RRKHGTIRRHRSIGTGASRPGAEGQDRTRRRLRAPRNRPHDAGSRRVIDLIVRILINAAALIAASVIVPNITLTIGKTAESWLQIGLIALVSALINTFLKPIVRLLSLPITLLTMGLVGLLINAGMLLILSWVSDVLDLPFKVANFPPTLNAEAIVAAL